MKLVGAAACLVAAWELRRADLRARLGTPAMITSLALACVAAMYFIAVMPHHQARIACCIGRVMHV